MSLWDIAIRQANEDRENKSKDEKGSSDESAVFILGSKNSGKTSIILRFLDRDEPPKPTVALEYTFGRRAKGHNIAKDVGHIWELGGGAWLSPLMDVPINASSLLHTTVVLVLDLSAPNELWFTMEALMQAARQRLDAAIAEARESDPYIKDKLKKKALERIGGESQDKNMMDPFLLPLVIVGSKYDIFQDFESEKRKVICKTLRFLALIYGASLQFFTIKQEQLVSKMRSIVSHHLFDTAIGKNLQLDHNKPLSVPFGHDSLQQIGTPPISDSDIGKVQARTPLELWKVAFGGYFQQTSGNNPAMVEDPAKDPQFAEPAIDTLRAQKDEELEKYRKLAERRAREAQRGYGYSAA